MVSASALGLLFQLVVQVMEGLLMALARVVVSPMERRRFNRHLRAQAVQQVCGCVIRVQVRVVLCLSRWDDSFTLAAVATCLLFPLVTGLVVEVKHLAIGSNLLLHVSRSVRS